MEDGPHVMHRGGYQLSRAETELKRAENLIEYHDEIMARPARTWFQSASKKQAEHGQPPVPRRRVACSMHALMTVSTMTPSSACSQSCRASYTRPT